MEQVIVIVALVIYWIFRGAAQTRKRTPDGHAGEAPLTRGGLDDAIEDAQQRAVEALQRWEARQRSETRPFPESAVPVKREAPGAPASPVRRTVSGRQAERERREVYADISRMLDPAARAETRGRRRGSLRVRTPREPREPAVSKWDQGVGREAGREAGDEAGKDVPGPTLVQRRRIARAEARSPGMRATAAKTGPSSPGAGRKAGPQALHERLERLPMAARAIVYSEILGPPPGLR